MTNDYLKTVEKLFKLHIVNGIHPLKDSILKSYSMFYSGIKNNVLQSHVTASITEIFYRFNKQVQNLKIFYKYIPHLCHSCYVQAPWVTLSVVVWWMYTLRFT